MLHIHYPLVYKDWSETEVELAVEMWHGFLADLDVRLVFAVTTKVIANKKNGFPPVVAEILEEYQRSINPSSFITPEEAWITVGKAIRKFGYMRENEALASLSHSAERAVKSIGWMNLCKADDTQFGFMRKQFFDAYRNVELDERAELITPKLAWKTIEKLSLEVIKEKGLLTDGHKSMPEM